MTSVVTDLCVCTCWAHLEWFQRAARVAQDQHEAWLLSGPQSPVFVPHLAFSARRLSVILSMFNARTVC